MPTFADMRRGYDNLFARAVLRPDRVAALDAICDRLLAARLRYETIAKMTGVPWWMIGALHYRESNLDFRCVLHNGERIVGTGRKTTLVPAGRGPFATFEAAACDALTMPPHALQNVDEWNLARVLYECERFNGFGYLGKCNSPYLWSFTDQYAGGKFIADHVFSPTAWDAQAGVAAIFKRLVIRGVIACGPDGQGVANGRVTGGSSPAAPTAAAPRLWLSMVSALFGSLAQSWAQFLKRKDR
jgi:lysozyme family protein